MNFSYTSKTTQHEDAHTEAGVFDFVNLKNKADGARRYGYRASVRKYSNPDGTVAFRSWYQTTLDGAGYQSSKYGNFVATEAEARAALAKTVAGAVKRYARLALDPASKIMKV